MKVFLAKRGKKLSFSVCFLLSACSVASQRLYVSACDLRRLKRFLASVGMIATKNSISAFYLVCKTLEEFLRNTAIELESWSHIGQWFLANAGAGTGSRGTCTHRSWWQLEQLPDLLWWACGNLCPPARRRDRSSSWKRGKGLVTCQISGWRAHTMGPVLFLCQAPDFFLQGIF